MIFRQGVEIASNERDRKMETFKSLFFYLFVIHYSSIWWMIYNYLLDGFLCHSLTLALFVCLFFFSDC